ncbi:murein L,D-transpeptidase catalytic domain family protein [Halomonas sp. SSL-5]|uniref:murein L,D-transpeptidase catalytic domain family protein n=1 Tax=Halomonas sp. SSL-5 TaxID=3065855 RepID=UPI002738CD12|nr:murein L,D-transpeptidase catalytic domain family protein [Halomonas sp. SSL-5]MDY7115587.1 murein L,D-transpeptidase catalytic domain family protein [Halomonas sp. SSL-5]
MMRSILPAWLLCAAGLMTSAPALADTTLAQALHPRVLDNEPLEQTLTRLAPDASREVLALAASALSCADPNAERLAVIDYSLPSSEPRLWVFDLRRKALLFEELVSHGRGSGDALASRFSNTPESHQSSLGLFRTMNTYYGRNGYSLRLEGLEPGVNHLAYERAIVMHGADYVSQSFIEQTGRLGRSLGCPAVRQEVTYPLIDSLKEEQYLFAYYPDPEWLASSAYLDCEGGQGQQLAMQ